MREKLKKLFSYYKPYRVLFYSDMFFAILGAVITLVIPLIVRYITNEVVYFNHHKAMQTILVLGAVMIGLVIIEFGCNYFIAYYGHIMGAYMEADMRSDIFGHYQKLTFAFYDNQKVGALLSRITSDLFDITELLHHGPEDVVISIIKLVGAFVILININAPLTIVAFVFVPVMALFAWYYNRKMKRAFKRNREKIADINSQIEDSLSGIRVVKSFANEEIEMKKFNQGNKNFVNAKKVSYRYMAGYNSGLSALTTLVTVAVLLAGVSFLTSGTIIVTDLVTFLLYINNFVEPVKKLMNFTEMFQNGYSGFERFQEIMAIAPDIKDEKDAIAVDHLKGDITFENVSFYYEESAEKVLNNIQLKVDAGDYMALVGPSGVGKTTLCSLIPRFYDVTKGTIKIGGVDVKEISEKELMSKISFVFQDSRLLKKSFKENIKMGSNASVEDIQTAVHKAQCDDIIEKFDQGLETKIGSKGVYLSGGETQRLTLARAIVKDAPILLLDEATAYADSDNEVLMQKAIMELAKDKTTIMIAHRLSTIVNVDCIYVVDNGEIIESGTHQELLIKNGLYAQMWHQYCQSVEWKVGEQE